MSKQGEKKLLPLPVILPLGTIVVMLVALSTAHYFPSLICPVKAQWGIDCPGCGGTRAAQSLIKGNLTIAFNYNAIITLGILMIAIYGIISLCFKVMGKKIPHIRYSLTLGISALLIIIVFTIIRNL